uniref:Uncharacterized protein n=1 Tax=Heliothis virescens TaxID=7102 RepID=A0A2A4J4P2_HELVI
MCTFENDYKTNHTWQHFYNGDPVIGYMPKIKSKISKYIFFLEDFDNNTYVKIVPNNSSHKIKLDSKILDDKNINTLLFNDTTEITFDCGEYYRYTKYLYLGLINTTENKIVAMSDTKITNKKYSKVYNASILCCLYYTTSENMPEMYITRYVQKKTMLIYQYKLPENKSILVNTTEGYVTSPRTQDSIYAACILVLAILLLFVSCLLVKKIFCQKGSKNLVETVELDTHATTGVSNTAYVNQDELRKQEESNYAEIIGVLNPYQNRAVPSQLKL